MTRHIVLFAYREGCTEEELRTVTDRFLDLQNLVPGIAEIEQGSNHSPEGKDGGYTQCFLLNFPGRTERDRYLDHPDHRAFSAFARPFLKNVLVFDYDVR